MNTSPATESNHRPYIVALTGGIASGKTSISDEFARMGVPVIDTDVIAHKIVEPKQPALKEITNIFGPKFIDTSGRLKRADLRALIFSNPTARKQLESILHPQIRQYVSTAIKTITAAYCILVVPLLSERGSYPYVNRILVVDIEPDEQICRLMIRDNCSLEQAKQALTAQANREQRLKIADDILSNSGSQKQARQKVKSLHKRYTQLAKYHHVNI